MKVRITSDREIKRRNMLFYVDCVVEFKEEERAIIRERHLADEKIFFEGGLVNYPEGAEELIEPWFLQAVARIAFAAGLVGSFFDGWYLVLCWIISFASFVFRKAIERDLAHARINHIAIRDLLPPPHRFSVCAFNHPLHAKALREEVREKLTQFKAVVDESAPYPEAIMFEL